MYVPCPPVAVMFGAEYGTPDVPFGRLDVVMVNGFAAISTVLADIGLVVIRLPPES